MFECLRGQQEAEMRFNNAFYDKPKQMFESFRYQIASVEFEDKKNK